MREKKSGVLREEEQKSVKHETWHVKESEKFKR